MSPTTTFNTCVVVNLDSINLKNSVEDNMRNLTLIIGLMGFCAYANAAPNIWSSSFNHGFDEYILTNSQNQKLTVMCNSAAADIFDLSGWRRSAAASAAVRAGGAFDPALLPE